MFLIREKKLKKNFTKSLEKRKEFVPLQSQKRASALKARGKKNSKKTSQKVWK